MATAPSIKFKSQPLHDFPLAHLRWARKNHHSPHPTTAHHLDSADSPEELPRGHVDHVVINSLQTAANAKPPSSSSSSRASRKPFSSTSSHSSGHQSQKAEKDDDAAAEDGRVEENNEVRLWNLRPRKVAALQQPTTSKFQDSKTVPSQKINAGNGNDGDKTTRLKGIAGEVGALGSGHGSERQRKVVEEKRKLWISLSKEEIDEDVYALTGSRPRKPKKRPRNVQKLLDVCGTQSHIFCILLAVCVFWANGVFVVE